ncbi:MAG TPA: hypothetical protein VKB67_05815 [Rhizomicrobium sp.]|nr:hypothetical protein [Rhizomicrobium sp.]
MHGTLIKSLRVTCRCGKVMFSAAGAPIVSAACYCTSCQQAGHQLEQLPSAPPVMDADGGTPVALYRKDRVQCLTGLEYLEERRLKPDSPTRRVLATCCNSGMFLDFTKGHWLSIYAKRFPAGAPPLEMRIMTKERRRDVVLPNDLPNYEAYPGRFILKLIAARIAMGFKRPGMDLRNIPRSTFGG